MVPFYTDRLFDGWNPVFERVFDASTELPLSDTVYVWGADLSGSMQGAGGVGGLLAVKRNGVWYAPLYDANGHQKSAKPKGNPLGDRDFIAVPKGQSEERYPATQRQLYVTAYVSETGVVVAEYEYDAFGATISQSGMMADTFRHRFSTKPWIAALGVYDFGERMYSPELRRWLSRDPIEEEGGANLYAMCGNDAVNLVDMLGMTDGFSSAIQQDKFIKIESKIAKYKKPWYRYVFKSPFLDIDISAKNKIKRFEKCGELYSVEYTIIPAAGRSAFNTVGKVDDPYRLWDGDKIRTNMGWRHMFRYTVDVEFNVDGKIYREYLWDLVANMNGRWTWDTIASKTLIRPITSGALSLTVTTHLHFV